MLLRVLLGVYSGEVDTSPNCCFCSNFEVIAPENSLVCHPNDLKTILSVDISQPSVDRFSPHFSVSSIKRQTKRIRKCICLFELVGNFTLLYVRTNWQIASHCIFLVILLSVASCNNEFFLQSKASFIFQA